MSDFDEQSITQAVLDRVQTSPDPRALEVSQALVRHLHAFLREVEPSMAEWEAGIDFLTRTGQMCTPTRQEFILLSDTLGASMLVDAMNHRFPEAATQTTVLGPFYVQEPPEAPNGSDISGDAPGDPLLVEGTVRDLEGRPLAGAVVDTWQADDDGYYDVQLDDAGTLLRARLRTDEQGRFSFWGVVPSPYPIPDDGPVGDMLTAQGRHPYRPAHVHFMVSAPEHVRLVTHLFLADDPYLDSDAVFGVKASLVRSLTTAHVDAVPSGRSAPDGGVAHLQADFILAREA
jgi:hydroxyquinol 1,2-dioxygenase